MTRYINKIQWKFKEEDTDTTRPVTEEVAFKVALDEWVSLQHAKMGRGLIEDTDFIKPFHDQDNFFSCDTVKFVFLSLFCSGSQKNGRTTMSLSSSPECVTMLWQREILITVAIKVADQLTLR